MELLTTFILNNPFTLGVLTWLGAHPLVQFLLACIAFLRVVNKPLMVGLKMIAKQTKTTRDDIFLENLSKAKWVEGLWFVLDWITSIKPFNI